MKPSEFVEGFETKNSQDWTKLYSELDKFFISKEEVEKIINEWHWDKNILNINQLGELKQKLRGIK